MDIEPILKPILENADIFGVNLYEVNMTGLVCEYFAEMIAALTILAVQQISDSTKYKFCYRVLKNLGLNKRECDKVVFKQLAVYYLCPFIVSLLLSMFSCHRFVLEYKNTQA